MPALHKCINMERSVITLTTDFGLVDSYVAEMKAAILSICANATIIDVTHQIEKFNVQMAAYLLASAAPYFPNGSIHVAVVDPGVGTKRRPIIVQTKKGFLVGPDNGVLALAVNCAEGERHVYCLTNKELMLPNVSKTFHGRDIFAPAAAHLANGTNPARFGREIGGMISPEFAKVIKKRDSLEGQIVHVDDFGNMITNFTEKDLEALRIRHEARVKIGGSTLLLRFRKAYGDVEKQQPLAVVGSHGFLEIAVNQGSAARALNAKVGTKIAVYPNI